MPPSASSAAALLAFAGVASCATSGPCPRNRVCGAASWIVTASSPNATEGRMVIAPAVSTAGPRPPEAEDFPVGEHPVLIKFDLSSVPDESGVDRAVLSLTPHPSWRVTGRAVRLFARGVSGAWTHQSVLLGATPSLDPDPATEVTLPAQARAPVRLDLTSVLRESKSGQRQMSGIALSTDGGDVVFEGLGAFLAADRPHLEVVLR